MVVISLLSFSLMVAAIVSYIIYKEESSVGKWTDRANKQDKLNQDTKNIDKHKKEMEALKRASGKKGK